LRAQEFKNIHGLQSIARGEKQPGKITATEASFLTISANDRIQLKSVYEDEWIKQTATLIAEVIQDRYEPERWVRIIGEDDIVGIQQITEKLKTLRFDVDIMSGITLPHDKEKRQQAFLMANQIVTQPVASPMTDVLLKELEIPGWQKILKKYQSWVQFMQFIQLMEAVKTGQIEPRQALRMLETRFAQELGNAAQQQGGQNARPQQPRQV
jgi:hypothetical protein